MLTEGTVVQIIGIIAKFSFPLLVSSVLLLFLPQDLLTKIGLSYFSSQFKDLIGLAFIVSGSFVLADAFSGAARFLKKRMATYRYKHRLLGNLTRLTPVEKNFLRLYIEEDSQTQYLSIENGVVKGLELKGFLVRVTSIGDARESTFAFNMQPIVFEHLKAHPDLIR